MVLFRISFIVIFHILFQKTEKRVIAGSITKLNNETLKRLNSGCDVKTVIFNVQVSNFLL